MLGFGQIKPGEKTHGLSKLPEYKVWENMLTRCRNKKTPYYKHYGGRGIRVCRRWQKSFLSFLEDMGRKPESDSELDRIDNNGNYCQRNCRWTSRKEQLNNRRGNRLVSIDGETKTVQQWSDISGVHAKTISCRLQQGVSPKDAVFGTLHGQQFGKGMRIAVDGVVKSVREWAKEIGLCPETIRQRIKDGWSDKEAVTIPSLKKNRKDGNNV